MIVAGQLQLAGAEVLGSLPVTNLFEGRIVQVSGSFYYYSSSTWEEISVVSNGVIPPQSGQAGKLLSTDGTDTLWQEQYPTQSGEAGKLLSTDGTNVLWQEQYPGQAESAGKFLQTDGSSVSWEDPPTTLPSQTGNNGKWLQTDGSSPSWVTLERYELSPGTPDYVVINNGTGVMSQEQHLSASRGGLAADATAFTGYLKATAGVFSAGSIAAGDLPTGIDAEKIADGSVTNTEFQYIGTLTSNAQTQINQNKSGLNTGILYGGALSINADPTKLDIAAGSGHIVDHSTVPPTVTTVTWTAKSAVPITTLGVLGSFATDIAIDINGDVVQQDSYTNTELRSLIFLGGVDHSGGTVINNTFSVQVPAYDAGLSVRDFARAVGDLNVSGNIISANGANLNINKSAGSTFAFGRNTAASFTDPHTISQASQTAASFNYVYSNGLGGATFTASTTNINPAKYDDGSGTLANVGTNKWTIQRVLMFSNTGNLFVQYGNAEYAKKEDAIEALGSSSFENLPGIRTAVVRGYIIVKQGSTVLNVTTSAVFIDADRFGGIGGVGVSNVATTDGDNTFTGTNTFDGPVIFGSTVTGLTSTMVGLGNVDDTSDLSKPISTLTQTALDLKANITSPTFAGTVGLPSGTILAAPSFTSYTDYALIASQSAPGSGVRVYGKSDGKLYKIDSVSGLESAIGGGLAPEAKTTGFTAVAGKHYLVNTSGGAVAVTLPAGTSEAAIKFSDANETWDTFNVTITPSSGETIDNLSADETLVCDVKRGWVELSWNGSKWVFNSLASTTVAEAGVSTTGTVNTTTQSFAGVKTFTNGALLTGLTAANATTVTTSGSGYVGETVTWASAPSTKVLDPSTTDWTNASITLSAGVWQIFANITVQVVTGTTAADNTSGVVYVTNSSDTVIQNMESAVVATTPAAASTLVTSMLAFSAVVNVSSSETYKIRGIRIDGAGTGSAQLRNQGASYSRFFAVRIA